MFQYVSILKWSFDLDDLGYPHDFGNPPVVPAREGGSLDFHEIAVAQLHQLRIAITGILRRSKWRTVELWKPHCRIVYEPIVNGKSLSKLLNHRIWDSRFWDNSIWTNGSRIFVLPFCWENPRFISHSILQWAPMLWLSLDWFEVSIRTDPSDPSQVMCQSRPPGPCPYSCPLEQLTAPHCAGMVASLARLQGIFSSAANGLWTEVCWSPARLQSYTGLVG